MDGPIIMILKRLIAALLAFIASLSMKPVKPSGGEVDPDLFLFGSEKAYEDYYLYCTEEDPEPYSWSPEALAARENVERVLISGNYSVTLFKNKTARINELLKPVENVVIPEKVEGYPVVAIAAILPYNDPDNASKIASKVKTAVIPDTVEFIMDDAFEDLSNLRSVQFGARVRFMQAYAFRDCRYLTSVALPDALMDIPVCAFDGCWALSSVTIGKNVRSVGTAAFSDCPNLKRVELPETVTSLGQQCFAMCRSLKYIYIPAAVTEIEENAFIGCGRLTIHGENGSYAQTFAAEQGIAFAQGK